MSTVFFCPRLIYDLESASKCDLKLYGAFFRNLRDAGLWLPPSQFETAFLSAAFTEAIVDEALTKAEEGIKKL
jgi:glutamate-1-semialdehyde 2,1-aminomutase